jgi:addiction module RelE/StbE family toxin
MSEKAKPNEEEWALALGFKESWQKFKTPALSEAMTVFNRLKRAIPPEPLPAKMHDHKLDGPLKGFMECHLDDDVLLIYKPLGRGAIKLLRICTHSDLRGPKAKVLAKLLKKDDAA